MQTEALEWKSQSSRLKRNKQSVGRNLKTGERTEELEAFYTEEE